MAGPQLPLRSGPARAVGALSDQTVTKAAAGAQALGIVGECGGGATRHRSVDQPWFGALPPIDEMETAMLEVAVEPGPLSRRSHPLQIAAALDGAVRHIPAGSV